MFYEVTISNNNRALARFAQFILQNQIQLTRSFARSEIEFDCIVDMPESSFQSFRKTVRPVYIDKARTLALPSNNYSRNDP